jgi:hypothetical protein
MASEIKSDKLSPSTGTALQIGDASDTITIPTGATFTITDGLGVAAGGTGLASFTAGDILYATGSTTLAKLAKGTAEQVLAMNSGATAPDWGSVDLTVLPTITVAKGGTNLSSFTAGDILYATGSTTLAKLAKGAATEVMTMNSGATAPEWAAAAAGGAFESKLLQVIDEKANNSAGGASTTGSFLTRDLNTVVTNEITSAALSSDQISLPAGTYYIQASVPAYESSAIQAKLYNITDTADELIGYGTGVNGSDGTGGWALVIGRFTIADTKVFEIQMRFGGAKVNNGQGLEMNYGVVEHYTMVQIWQM